MCKAMVFIEKNPFKLEGHAQPHHVAAVLKGCWLVTLEAYAGGRRSCACKLFRALQTRRKLWTSRMFMDQHPEAWGIISKLATGSWTILQTPEEFAAQKAAAERLKRSWSVLGLGADHEATEGEQHVFVLDTFVRNFHRCDRAASVIDLGHM